MNAVNAVNEVNAVNALNAGTQWLLFDVETFKAKEAFDGFYAVCTNLEDDVAAIVAVNHAD